MQADPVLAPAALYKSLAQRIEAETGLCFAARVEDLRRAMGRMAEALGFSHAGACAAWLLAGDWDRDKADACAPYLTVSETYFFREPRAFSLVLDYAREKIAGCGQSGKPVRIWSAGCCTGEEAYSIAILLRQHLPRSALQRISILGTDINGRNLEAARAAAYRHWSFRNADPALWRPHFRQMEDGRFRLNQEIREMVTFAALNLAAPQEFPAAAGIQAMDIIFCRNVLMYFSRAQARKAIARFRQCLVEGGWLVVNPSEASAELFEGFSAVYFPDAVYFRKTGPGQVAPARTGLAIAQPPSRPALAPRLPLRPKRAGETAASPAAASARSGKPEAADPDLYHSMALSALEAGDGPAALHNLKRVLYLRPDCIVSHYLLGTLHASSGRLQAAARQFETASGLLASLGRDEVVPRSEGLSAAYLLAAMQLRLQGETT
ncbi:MAG: CheR family methyltransferase [Noviherbaspirillum sp.]